MSDFDVFDDDPIEQRMKSSIAQWFRDEQSRKLEQARSLAISLEDGDRSPPLGTYQVSSCVLETNLERTSPLHW